ncbi:MAG: hypothetical protein ACD_16C00049G0002 [uncultured bacterium]|nr:MAG: hypothetical protein ACD_16C00049G0002 [uncultured bacterium]OFW67920.1 MAG: hypothetical protein A2X70_06285 [Alphaproteobacteria bacterium GWC2_42_16]OFW73755.1 MAG: hypothetical protein A2Z80_01355 [Alphaproteobacteria bacterium GWA2_41_27]OFW82165.1 MAG: hypothetical protein A3E50_04995 [Alphaproteobacteria bacterium RIFCSPHIGHO2_12_FULL_42_100]OFW85178.1 MAG: hypothetical protein A2W06_02285 [Alphaproteobacteria bacterium RBG_16_42_14]OFW91348.1 MAG: hypothetical protein A3C41_081
MSLSFRPHHFLCTLGFEGMGYSPEFVENYTEINDTLQNNEEHPIQVSSGSDSICAVCPHHKEGMCGTEEKIRALDERHCQALELSPGDVLTWAEAKQRIKDKMTLEAFHVACRGCQWKELGLCEKALKNHRGKK